MTPNHHVDLPAFKNKTVHKLFEEHAASKPEKIALVYEGSQLTYRELNEKSNQLARQIRYQYKQRKNKEMLPDTLVALCVDRSLEMVVCMLAILKAGGAYVPIDPSYPQERIKYIVEDTQSELILTQRHVYAENRLEVPKDKVFYADLTEHFYSKEAATNLADHSHSTDLAYVIYTSGTSGRPKGVMIEHHSVLYYLHCFSNLHSGERICSILNYCFDAALPTLLSGVLGNVTTYVAKNDILLDHSIEGYINANKIDIIRFTPSMLPLIDFNKITQELTIVLGGEKINLNQVNVLRVHNKIKLFNQYGPTECTVGSTVYQITEQLHHQLIGKSYDGKRTYVLDATHNRVPVDRVGELHIGGAGLARGYLNSVELTKERFITDPFATETEKAMGYGRLYKTGDLVRQLADGNLEYVGRNDDQVKIRGYRVELGEIEKVLTQVKGILQCCVLCKEETGMNNRFLVGYYVLRSGVEELTSSKIQETLAQQLPEYMVPSVWMEVQFFPLTSNGKLDKQALPTPAQNIDSDYVAPRTSTEKAICDIWKEIFGLDRVGLLDNFFQMGGNSILAIQLSHKVSKVLGYPIGVGEIFKSINIMNLLKDVKVLHSEDANVIWKF